MMPVRTSRTHPLHIDWVRCLAGRIGMTICPGQKGEPLIGERWERDLVVDLTEIAGSGCTTLVTLIEDYEFGFLGITGFPEAVNRAGLRWLHLPVSDIDVPDGEFERAWTSAGQELRERLGRGEKVVLHCRGGLGRTGLIAARLLVATGAEPEAAIAMVRAARPGTVETADQEDYIHFLPAVPHGNDRA